MYPIITIDIGNTRSKKKKWINSSESTDTFDELSDKNIRTFFSSVTNEKSESIHSFDVSTLFIDGKFLDMPVHYENSIGIDRLVTSYYVFNQNQTPSILIDAGTFTKIEYITKDGFQGGYILPGTEILKATYQSGNNLKDYPINLTTKGPLPSSSIQAIDQGFSYSVLAPIKEILQELNFENIYLTGGNAQSIFKHLEHMDYRGASIHLEPDLIHMSLAHIATKVLK